MIRVILPAHLRILARVDGEVRLEIEGAVTQRSILDALESRYPALGGTLRDHVTGSGGRSCGSSPASRTYRTNRRMRRCRPRSPKGRNHFWLLEP